MLLSTFKMGTDCIFRITVRRFVGRPVTIGARNSLKLPSCDEVDDDVLEEFRLFSRDRRVCIWSPETLRDPPNRRFEGGDLPSKYNWTSSRVLGEDDDSLMVTG